MFSRVKSVVSMSISKLFFFVSYLMVPLLVMFIAWYYVSQGTTSEPRSDQQHALLSSNETPFSSSVWCRGSDHSDRICRFRNLCYNPKIDEFLFFHGTNTTISGISIKTNVKSPLADLTSILGMNTHYFALTDLPSSAIHLMDIEFMDARTAIVMKRFKPDNLMHVFHDDLIPLFETLRELCFDRDPFEECIEDVKLVFLDGHAKQEYYFLYQLFSGLSPLLLDDLNHKRTYCFLSAIVGISKETGWYDYGYERPQGPKSEIVSAVTLQRFVEFTLKRLELDRTFCSIKFPIGYVVLILRKSNRLILNEAQVAETAAAKTRFRVVNVYLEKETLRDVIELVSCSEMLIGMHGAAMILSLFLRKEKSVLELFPYAVPSSRYTPYRTLASIIDMKLKYGVWENKIKQNTVTHPDWDLEHGGLNQLGEVERDRIMDSDTVPPHRCCSDPEWLFRIYQDTVVDIESFSEAVERILDTVTKTDSEDTLFLNNRFYPGPVRNLSCIKTINKDSGYLLSWDSPWNLQFVMSVTVYYEIWIQSISSDDLKSVITNGTSYQIISESNEEFNCWISCSIINNNKTGLMQWVNCK